MRQVRAAIYVAIVLAFARRIAGKLITTATCMVRWGNGGANSWVNLDITTIQDGGKVHRYAGIISLKNFDEGRRRKCEDAVRRLNAGEWKNAFHNHLDRVSKVVVSVTPAPYPGVGSGYITFRLLYGIQTYSGIRCPVIA